LKHQQATVHPVEGRELNLPAPDFFPASLCGFTHARAQGNFCDSGLEQVMAQKCDLCGKGPQFGNNISHAHNTTRRRWNVNLQSVKAKVDGGSKRIRVCTSCIKTGKIVKG
jgi:large subunit ribosomal protein L28